ncbi:ABC-F family ATP-binding cassette domain-containing protein, partial [archaeon]
MLRSLLFRGNRSLIYDSSRGLSETVLSFKNVTFEYSALKPILNNATFNVEEGRKVTIMGQNGSGKSTLLKLINGKLTPQKGSINLKKGFAVSTALQVITPDDRKRTVLEFFTHYLHGTVSGIDGRIAAALQKVKLTAPHSRLVGSFSGGQQARLLLASALIVEPDILLLDEPTNNLDVAGIEVLREMIVSSKKTVVVISHDEKFLNSFSDSVLYIDNHFKSVESYAGNYLFVKEEIAKRIARENAENARLHKEAQQKKEQANVFAHKGGSMRKAAKKLKEQAIEIQSAKVVVRKEDREL